jgi:hypothetical protein
MPKAIKMDGAAILFASDIGAQPGAVPRIRANEP